MAEGKKTPSPKVIATMWVLDRLDGDGAGETISPEYLTELSGSRVSAEKVEKVDEQVTKITAKFLERLKAIVDKFKGVVPKAKKKPVSKSGGGVVSKKKVEDEEDAPVAKKKKKKRPK